MDFKTLPQETTEWALQSTTPADEKLELSVPPPKLPRSKKNIAAYRAKLGEAETWYDPMEDTKSSPTIQETSKTFNDVEMTLSCIKNTLGYLDQALDIIEQRLRGVEDVLSAREPFTNEEHILPHLETLYNSIPRAAEEDALAEEDKGEYGEPYSLEIDQEYTDDQPQTGDSLHWRFAEKNHNFQESWDSNVKRTKHVPFATWEGRLRNESEVDSLGYMADDEISPPLAKVFEK